MLERSAARMDEILAPRAEVATGYRGYGEGYERINDPGGGAVGVISFVNRWPARRDSNPRPTDPKSVALIH